MGTDHGKKIKTPLGKPKVIDEIGTKKKVPFKIPMEEKNLNNFFNLEDTFKKFQKQRKAEKAKKKAGESSKKTTITDTQKRGQIGLRYDLFEGRKRPLKKPTEKKVSPGSKSRKKSKNFLPHKIQQKLPTVRDAVYTFPEDKKPKFLRKKTSGSA
tara:strand:- start:1373 stop:1837 length:465 start_codon:yes stop_codon:yes gene_type:complete